MISSEIHTDTQGLMNYAAGFQMYYAITVSGTVELFPELAQ